MDHRVSVSLDACSIWAEFKGAEAGLDSIEYTLENASRQVSGRTKLRGVPPFIRSAGLIKCLAGLLPVAWPDHDWPVGYDVVGDYGLELRLTALEQEGWRDYQIASIRAALTAPLGRGIIELGTGAGKTRVAWGLAYAAGGGRWLYCVYGRDLVSQSATSFRTLSTQLKANTSLITSVGWNQRDFQSADYAGIIIDECHGISARTRAQCMACFRGGLRYGLSGTPLDRTDDKNPLVVGLLGPVIYRVGVRDLTSAGFLSTGKVVFC